MGYFKRNEVDLLRSIRSGVPFTYFLSTFCIGSCLKFILSCFLTKPVASLLRCYLTCIYISSVKASFRSIRML